MRSTHENVFAEDTLAAHNIAAGDQTPAPIVKLGDRKRPAVELPRLRLWGGESSQFRNSSDCLPAIRSITNA